MKKQKAKDQRLKTKDQRLNPASGIQHPETRISIHNPKSVIRNPQSAIFNSQSSLKLRWLISITIVAIFGLGISVYLTIHHYRIMSGLPEYQSFCTVSEYIDCDMVNSSSYSEFRGLPLALFGAGGYAAILGLMVLSFFARGIVLERYIGFISFTGLVAFGFSVYLAYVSLFILHAVCILCAATYFINLFMFLGGRFAIYGKEWFYSPIKTFLRPLKPLVESESLHPMEDRRYLRIGGVAGILIVVMVIIQGFFSAIYLDAKYIGFTAKDIKKFMREFMDIKQQVVDIKGAPYWGNGDADYTIVVFEDFLCNFCKRAHVTSFPIFKEYKDRIKIVFKHLPYDQECNPSLEKSIHPGACRAAIASACASLQGEFSRFQEYFFSHREKIRPDMDITEAAADIGGVDIDRFKKCVDKGEGEWLVRKDFNQAIELGVNKTPAYFFNGRKWEGALKPIFIRKILELEL